LNATIISIGMGGEKASECVRGGLVPNVFTGGKVSHPPIKFCLKM